MLRGSGQPLPLFFLSAGIWCHRGITQPHHRILRGDVRIDNCRKSPKVCVTSRPGKGRQPGGITMRKVLLSTTSLLGVALVADAAAAADGIKLAVGGFFREAYMVNFDDDGEGELGNERNTDGFFNDAEIHF